MANPRVPVEAPVFSPLPFGLLESTDEAQGPDHWQMGVEWQQRPRGVAGTTLDSCIDAEVPTKVPTGDGMPVTGTGAFTVYTWIDCSALGFTDRAEQLTIEHLTNGEERAVERALWTGLDGALDQHLASADAETLGGGAVSLLEAFAALSGAIGVRYGGEGVIHAPSWLGEHLFAGDMVTAQRGVLRANRGHRVVLGDGYPGTGPGGSTPAAGNAWLYGTGPVVWRRGAIATTPVNESMARATNDVVVISERTYVVAFDGPHFAVQADVGSFTPPTE